MSPRTKRIGVVVVVVLVLLAGGATYLLLRDKATPVDVDEAVDRYRAEQGTTPETSQAPPRTTPAAGADLPAEGVYVYETDGSERIDILGGSTHDYPAETTVTIRHTNCGLRQRWSPLEERWDQEQVCTSEAGRERRALRTHHEFFGISDDQDFSCPAGYVLLPVLPEVGERWSTTCDAGDTVLTGSGEVVGFENRDVGGTVVETVHVRITEQAAGSDVGPSSDDYWWRTSDGLLIARASKVDTRSDSPVGTAAYTEGFTLRLTSLTPRT